MIHYYELTMFAVLAVLVFVMMIRFRAKTPKSCFCGFRLGTFGGVFVLCASFLGFIEKLALIINPYSFIAQINLYYLHQAIFMGVCMVCFQLILYQSRKSYD